MKKKIFTLILTSAVLLTSTAFAKDYPQKFWDVSKDHWAFEYIADLADRGVINGYEDGSFKPEHTVSRAEWAKIMVDAAGVQTSDNAVYFTDMSASHWANKYVNAAKSYLTGYSDNSYRPNQAAVREDVTVAMVRLKGYNVSDADYSYLSDFTDVSSISDYAKAYVAVAVQNDLISGFEDNTFRGQDTLTRAEAATLLYRAFQLGSANKTVDAPTEPITSADTTKTSDSSYASQAELTTTATPAPSTSEYTQQAEPTATATPKPTPDPTPEPEKPYVLDTITSADIGNTFRKMTTDGDNVYYLDNSDNVVYKINMQSEKITEIANISDLTLDVEVESREEDGGTITEQRKDFEVSKLFYDTENDKLLISGTFKYITDYYGLEDKWDNYSAFIDVDTLEEYDKELVAEEIPDGGVWNAAGKLQVKNGNNVYQLESDSSYYRAYFNKYNFNEGEWEAVEQIWESCPGIGCRSDAFYVWNLWTGQFIKWQFNTKKTELGMNSQTNVDVLDFKKIPKNYIEDIETAFQIFVSGDEQRVIFYDSSNECIRIFKER